ncbi:MAG: hypothetical protein FWG77_01415 [Treponema sp.]|nr:hypothetical protein [Treponema sp.]
MDIKIEYNESAFEHGVSKESIVHAIKTKVYDAPLLGYSNKYILIGFDINGNPLELMYNPDDNDVYKIYVFHAMRARKKYLAKLGFRSEML